MMGIKDCCKDPKNLRAKQLQPDTIVNTCQVCGCRHFRLYADPGIFSVIGRKLGEPRLRIPEKISWANKFKAVLGLLWK